MVLIAEAHPLKAVGPVKVQDLGVVVGGAKETDKEA